MLILMTDFHSSYNNDTLIKKKKSMHSMVLNYRKCIDINIV